MRDAGGSGAGLRRWSCDTSGAGRAATRPAWRSGPAGPPPPTAAPPPAATARLTAVATTACGTLTAAVPAPAAVATAAAPPPAATPPDAPPPAAAAPPAATAPAPPAAVPQDAATTSPARCSELHRQQRHGARRDPRPVGGADLGEDRPVARAARARDEVPGQPRVLVGRERRVVGQLEQLERALALERVQLDARQRAAPQAMAHVRPRPPGQLGRGVGRDAHDLGDLLVVEVLDLAQGEDLALAQRQLRVRLADLLLELAGEDGALGLGQLAVVARLRGRLAAREALAAVGDPQAGVVRRAEQVGPRRDDRPAGLADRLEHAHEGLVGRVGGFLAGAQHPAAVAVDRAGVALVELGEGLRVAAPGCCRERGVGGPGCCRHRLVNGARSRSGAQSGSSSTWSSSAPRRRHGSNCEPAPARISCNASGVVRVGR